MTGSRWAIVALAVGCATFAGVTPAAAATCSPGTPTLTTNKAIYGPAESVTISGCGFSYLEPLLLKLTPPDTTGNPSALLAVSAPLDADENGSLLLPYDIPSGNQRQQFGRFVVEALTPGSMVLATVTFERRPPVFATCPTVGGVARCWGQSTGDPDFFWLPPTVPAAAPFTGPFDGGALDDLVVEVCELNEDAQCADGEPVARFTATEGPTPARLTRDLSRELYTLDWQTGRNHLDRDAFYRIRVLRDGREIGTLDVDLVQNTPELSRVDPLRYIGIKRGEQFTISFRVQRPTARTRVKINEVESNGGVPGDWIELHNTASVPVSIAGYVVKDNDDAHSLALPDVMIPAGGYYVVEESALGFGLGGADSARLFAPDGATLVDTYNWSVHAPVTTYGRCPDGIGDFQINTTVTKGAANDCSTVIRLNEVESSGGTPGDWVELFNPGPGPANLKGFVLMDSDNLHVFSLPGVVIPADGYIVLNQSSFGFDLGDADAVRIVRPDGTLADAYAWATPAVFTYGRCPNGNGALTQTLGATKGTANKCFVPVTTLHINEVESNQGTPGDWVELTNTGSTPIDLSGWRLLDNDSTHVPYTFPAGSSIRRRRVPRRGGKSVRLGTWRGRQREALRPVGWTVRIVRLDDACRHNVWPLPERNGCIYDDGDAIQKRRERLCTAGDNPSHQRGRIKRRLAGRLGRTRQHRRQRSGHLRLENARQR